MSREQDLEKDKPGVLAKLRAVGICFGKQRNTAFVWKTDFESFPSSNSWDLTSHIMQSLQPILNIPPFPIHPSGCPFSSHPSCHGLHGGSGLPVTHPALGRSSPRGQGETGGCQARRAGAGQTRTAAGWPCRRAGVGAVAPCWLRGPPQRQGSQCPGHCWRRGEGVRGEDLHLYFRSLFYLRG